jgi:hypothetical protein
MSRNRPQSGRPGGWVPLARVGHGFSPQQIDALRRAGLTEEQIAQQEADNSEAWKNNIYTVIVTRWTEGPLAGAVQELSIRRNDRKPITDWRHEQRIKTEIAGPEVEAMKLYPAESRLMDTANQTYLFCLPPGQQFPVGWQGPRLLQDADDADGTGAVQRELPEDWKAQPYVTPLGERRGGEQS